MQRRQETVVVVLLLLIAAGVIYSTAVPREVNNPYAGTFLAPFHGLALNDVLVKSSTLGGFFGGPGFPGLMPAAANKTDKVPAGGLPGTRPPRSSGPAAAVGVMRVTPEESLALREFSLSRLRQDGVPFVPGLDKEGYLKPNTSRLVVTIYGVSTTDVTHFNIRLALEQPVYLSRSAKESHPATTWSESASGEAAKKDAPRAIRDRLGEMLDSFADHCRRARKPVKE